MDNKKLINHYYSPQGYYKGYEAINKLAAATNIDKNVIKKWLQKQAIWQIYLPKPQYIPRYHWNVEKVNQIHQADLLFLPHDTVKRKTYKYALVVVDVASRYVDAEPLTSKYALEVSKAFEKIYSRRLNWPETIIVDPGTEFMGNVTKIMKNKNVNVQRSEANNHRAQALVERANRTIAEKLFSHQYAKEMIIDNNERSREWVERLPAVIKSINNGVKRITGKTPIDAIKMKIVNENHVKYKRPVGLDEIRLPQGVKVRYLYQPGELEGGSQRATDPIWSLEIYDISRTVVSANQPVLYYLSDGAPKRNFVREELQVVPEDTVLPPNKLLN